MVNKGFTNGGGRPQADSQAKARQLQLQMLSRFGFCS